MFKKIAIHLALVATTLLAGATNSHAYYKFGVDGSDGFRGYNGVDGVSGQSIVVTASGTRQTFLLNGKNGGDGTPGSNGQDAWNCFPETRPRYNLVGANGGNGGDGGRGGDGGNGGDVTIYYTDIKHLRNIFIEAIGGTGGRGTYAGRPGRGCYCYERYWTVRDCRIVTKPDGTQVKECWDTGYSCQDGNTGWMGTDGRHGISGRLGALTLIKSTGPLLPNKTSSSLKMELLDGANVELAYNTFAKKSGALSLLEPGSLISDTYTEYTGRNTVTASFSWQAPRTLTDFQGLSVALSHSGSEVVAQFPQDLWLETDVTQSGAHKNYVIRQALKESESRNVNFSVESVTYKEAFVRIKDLAPQKELLKDDYKLVLWRSGGLAGDQREYDDVVDSSLLISEGDDLLIPLHKLAVKNHKKTFKKNERLKVKVSLTRSFNKYSTNITTEEIVHKLPKK